MHMKDQPAGPQRRAQRRRVTGRLDRTKNTMDEIYFDEWWKDFMHNPRYEKDGYLLIEDRSSTQKD